MRLLKPEMDEIKEKYKDDMQTIQVELDGHERMLLDALMKLKKVDPSLSFRRSCREGVCGSDAMNINGKNGLACLTNMLTLPGKIVLKPLPGLPVVRDFINTHYIQTLGRFFFAFQRALPDLSREDLGFRLNFAMGDAKSTSGTLAPMTYLFAPNNIQPEKCFKAVKNGNHQSNLFATARGMLDVSTNNTTAVRLQVERGAEVTNQIRVIWESPKLPEDPIIWRKDLDPAVKEKLRQFFLTYGQGEGPEAERQRKLLSAISIGGFKPADANHLLPVQEMEATEAWLVAKNGTDAAKTAEALKALDAVRAERAALEAKTGQPAAAQ